MRPLLKAFCWLFATTLLPLSAAILPSFLSGSFFVQDLLQTLQTAAEIELSLTAAAAPDQKTAASPQRRALPHQQQPQQQQVQQPPLIAITDGGGGGGVSGGVDVHEDLNGEGLTTASSTSDSSGSSSSGDDDGNGSRDDDGAFIADDDDETLAGEEAATEGIWSSAGPGARGSGPATVRTAAVGARAQELAAARFAGMRSAAEAKSAASAASAAVTDGSTSSRSKPESSVAPSFGKGKSAVPIAGPSIGAGGIAIGARRDGVVRAHAPKAFVCVES